MKIFITTHFSESIETEYLIAAHNITQAKELALEREPDTNIEDWQFKEFNTFEPNIKFIGHF